MKITKHGQSCFLIETKQGSRILIDPGTYVFGDKEKLTSEDFKKIDILIITHEHSDHFDIENVKKIIQSNPQIKIFTTTKVKEILGGSDKVSILGSVNKEQGLGIAGDITITGVVSRHGKKDGFLPSGDKAPAVTGVLIEADNKSFYHPGDTIELKITADVIATPICGVVVLDIEEAKEQLLSLKPKIAIPMHYDNSAYPVDPTDFIEAMKDTGIDVKVLGDGETIEL